MRFINVLAPRLSKRRLVLSILRDFRYRPASIFHRLGAVNFHNARLCANLPIHCCVCGHDGKMLYDFPDVKLRKDHGIGLLRETLRCRSCGSSMRDRQMATGLLQLFATRTGQNELDLRALREKSRGGLRILDSDSFSSINGVLRGLPGYVHSQFLPGVPNGKTIADGSVNVNLEDMPFAEGSFDVIMTSDVMEHVANDDRAHREIFRCLAPRGTYLFTVPYDSSMVGHRRLTQRTGQSSSYFLLDRHVHGDPHAGSGIIAHKIYGRQLLDDLADIGYRVRFEEIDLPANGVFGGDLFFANKEH